MSITYDTRHASHVGPSYAAPHVQLPLPAIPSSQVVPPAVLQVHRVHAAP